MSELFNEIKRLVSAGKKVMGCCPPYPPLELFHSLGFAPVVLWDDPLGSPSSLAETIIENSRPGDPALLDGLFVYNPCGQFSDPPEKLEELLGKHDIDIPVFSMEIPMELSDGNFQDELLAGEIGSLVAKIEKTFRLRFSGASFFKNVELYRRMRQLAKDAMIMVSEDIFSFSEYSSVMTGNNILPVDKQISALDELISKYRLLPPEEIKKHPEIIKMRSLIQGGEKNKKTPGPGEPKKDAINAVLSGAVLPSDDVLLFLEESGVRIIENDLCALTRTNAYTPRGTDNPAAYYVDFYKNHFPCPTLPYTNVNRESGLMEIIRGGRVKAVIYSGGGCQHAPDDLAVMRKLLEKDGTMILSVSDGSFRPQILKLKDEVNI